MDQYNYLLSKFILQFAKESDDEVIALSFLLSSVIRLALAIMDILDPEIELREDVVKLIEESGLYTIFSDILDEMFSLVSNGKTERIAEIVNRLDNIFAKYSDLDANNIQHSQL